MLDFDDVRIIDNPSQDELRRLTLEHTPGVLKTSHGNLDKISRNKARVAQYTYVIAPESDKERYSSQLIDPRKAREHIEAQAAYIREQGTLIRVDGYQGLGEHAVGVRWLYSLEGANIAGMQQVLAFPRADVDGGDGEFQPVFHVVYTPDFRTEGLPGRQAVLVDLENYVTYIMGPDYFGESKKAALRMLCKYVYDLGGLVLHAGAKEVSLGGRRLTMTIKGLSGTGKTTTTFSKQGEATRPIQDDMVSLWPGGQVSITENGCFAKTYGLTEESEPTIYRGTIHPSAWVENVYVSAEGGYAFSKDLLSPQEVERYREVLLATGASAANVDRYIGGQTTAADIVDERGIPKDGWDFVVWTQNGRSIIPMSAVEDAADLRDVPPVASMGILNRDEGPEAAMPGIVRFTEPARAAAYFMLGETSKTSAAGKDRGKTRSPFTQPFFPLTHGLQARRFRELLAGMDQVDTWLMNTGFVGGDARDVAAGKALKVKIRHSSAMLEALLAGTIAWKQDPDFGYQIVDVDAEANKALLEAVPAEILNPVRFFEQQGRAADYRAWVERMKTERRAFLQKFGVDEDIVAAV